MGRPNGGTGGAGCDATAGTIIKTSGYDKSFPASLGSSSKNGGIYGHLGYKGTKKSNRWTYIGKYLSVKDKLQPGDVLLGQQKSGTGHVLIYVGNKIAKEVYKSKLKGTDADLGTPNGQWVSGHHDYAGGSAACICKNGWALVTSGLYEKGAAYKVYRCTTPAKSGYKVGKVVK